MVDLFAGCGGLSQGMENAGFTPVFASELSHDAMNTYKANRKTLDKAGLFDSKKNPAGRYCYDINNLVCNGAKELKALKKQLLKAGDIDSMGRKGTSLDLVCGGPPCQGYSGIGHRRSYSVDKKFLPSNELYQKMAVVVRELKPKIFFFENVKGLLSARWFNNDPESRKGEIWEDVFNEFKFKDPATCKQLSDYIVRWELVYAKDYGVPQNRPRVLMVGVRKDIAAAAGLPSYEAIPSSHEPSGASAVKAGFLPAPKKGEYPDPEELLGDLEHARIGELLDGIRTGKAARYIDDFATREYPRKPKKGSIQEYFRTHPKGEKVKLTQHEYSKHKRSVVEKFHYMIESGGEIPEHMRTKKFAQRVLKRRWPEDGPNITATSLPDDYVHYSQPRILSVREWARLQMFPDWYEFTGKRTTGGLRRAGNPREGVFDREVPMYTQIGNAVPVRLAEAVGQQFAKILSTS